MRGSTQQKGEQGWRKGESTCLPPMCRGFESRTGVICGLSLLVVLFLAPRGFSPGIPTFLLSSLTKVSKFQFDLNYCQSLYHESMTRVIARALPVICIKFALTFFLTFCYHACRLFVRVRGKSGKWTTVKKIRVSQLQSFSHFHESFEWFLTFDSPDFFQSRF